MRKLKLSDVPALCRCIKALDIKGDVQQLAKDASSAADVWEKGFDLVWSIFDKATETTGEKSIYKFFSGPFEMTPEETENMPIPEFIDKMKQLAKENDLVDFFRFAGDWMRSKS